MGRRTGALRVLALATLGIVLQGAVSVEAQTRRGASGDRMRGERVDTTFAFASDGTLEIVMPGIGRGSADVLITGWERGEMRIRGETDQGELALELGGRHVEIGTRSTGGMTRVDRLEIQVPRGTRVTINNGGGDVIVRGTRGPVSATSFNGDITVTEATDRLELKTFNGDIRATDVTGRVSVNASNGDVRLENVRGDIEVNTLNGDIGLRTITSTNVRAKTMSGRIVYDGTVDRAGQYNFNAFSGAIDMAIPASTGATLTVSTFSGTIDSPDFPLTLKPGSRSRESRGQSMTFDLGNGGARISLESFSGEIRIRERRASGQDN